MEVITFFCFLLTDFIHHFFHQRAVEVMCFVPKRCNDMMNVGRLQGFDVRILFFVFCQWRSNKRKCPLPSVLTCGFRGKSQLRASCFSRILFLSVSRNVDSWPEPRRGGSSCLSSWLFSVSRSTRKKASLCQGTLLKTASRWEQYFVWRFPQKIFVLISF